MADEISFRPLAEADLPLMAGWLNRSHLRRFFQREPISLAEIALKYGARIRGEAPTKCWLALMKDAPFGYLQSYRVADWPEWQATIGVGEGISVDLFIGEAELIGRGHGRRMLRGFVEQIAFPANPEERLCWIGHQVENSAARRCSVAAGFAPVREYDEEGRRYVLMVRPA